jgi:hypothetical protein
MIFEIDGLGPREANDVSAAALRGRGGFESALKTTRDARASAETDSSFPTTPPPEVTEAVGSAFEAYDELNATGQQLHFTVDPPTGAFAVELVDLDGNPLTTISASEALRIAAGKSLT